MSKDKNPLISPPEAHLTERQKALAREMVHKLDLTELTRLIFDDQKIDARTKEGRLLRKFLSEENIPYTTKAYEKQESIVLTEEQKSYIKEHIDTKGKLTLAREIFKNNKIKNLSMEARAVSEYIDYITGQDRSGIYSPPKAVSRVISKVNKYCNLALEESKLSTMDKERCMFLLNCLNSERFVRIISELEEKDRDLFESEFITHTFDKPDLTPEEVNLYINLCGEYVSEVAIQRQIRLLDDRLEELTEDDKFSKPLADTIKTKIDERDSSKARQERLIGTLIGKRSERIKSQQNRNKDILSLVHAFMKEEERLRAIKIAERQRALVEKAVDDIESSSAFFARIVGPSRDEILN